MPKFPHLSALALYVLLALLFTWPLALQIRQAVPSDLGDPILNTWILWWNARALPLSTAWWNAPAFYPTQGVLAFSETLLGIAWLTNPIQWVGGGPQLAYNLAFLLSFPISAIGAYLLTYELTGRRDAAWIAGLIYGWNPFRVAHLPQLQVISGYWMPLGLYGLHRYLREPKPRWLVCFAACWLLQGLSNGYYLLFYSVLVGTWLLWFMPGRSWREVLAVSASWVVAMVAMLPVLIPYRAIHRAHGFVRNPDEIQHYSADITAVLCTPSRLALWGWMQGCQRPENELFPGLTLASLLVVALVYCICKRALGPGKILGFYLSASLLMWLFSLGPSPTLRGESFLSHGPYQLLMVLPGFDALRVPARFQMLTLLCLAVVAGFAFVRLAPRNAKLSLGALCLVSAGVLADSWLREMPIERAPARWSIEEGWRDVPLLELPAGSEDGKAMYRSIYHERTLINGRSGNTPPYYGALMQGLSSGNRDVLGVFASQTEFDIALDRARDPKGALLAFLEGAPGVRRLRADATHVLFRVTKGAARSGKPPPLLGEAVQFAQLRSSANEADLRHVSDGDLVTRWSPGKQDGEPRWLEIDLGRPQPVAAVVLALGPHSRDFPYDLSIELANDEGGPWRQVFRGSTSAQAFAAALRDPSRIPVAIGFAPESARFIKLTNYGRDDGGLWWSIAELAVHAP